MPVVFRFFSLIALIAVVAPLHALEPASVKTQVEIVVSVAEQKLAVVKDGVVVKKYPVSTSKFGLGDSAGSYRTPLGHLRVCAKIGDRLPEGAVLRGRTPTGEILPPNARGRDPIVTRILWLEGLDPQNRNARNRGIYIHGTPEEKRIGKPASFGCVRMRSRDVIEVFATVPEGTSVVITAGRIPKAPQV